jgi:hypothetical protein
MAGILFALAPVWPAQAGMIHNDYNDYGHATTGYGDTDKPGPYCAATAFANSFAFLQNKYPKIYPIGKQEGRLTNFPQDPIDARNALIGLQKLAGNGKPPNLPASLQTIWESMIDYFNFSGALKSTIFEAELDPTINTAGWKMANVIQNVIPTPDFLLSELKKGEDVEIAFRGIPLKQGDLVVSEGAHMVTLTGIDTTKMTLTYLDPNNPSKEKGDPKHPGLFTASYTINAKGYIVFNWDNKVNPPVNNVFINQAFAESPNPELLGSPEPSTFVLAIIGLCGVGVWNHTQKKRTRKRL